MHIFKTITAYTSRECHNDVLTADKHICACDPISVKMFLWRLSN